MAFTHAHVTLQHLGVTDDQAMLFERLASRMFGADASCISPGDLARNTFGQNNLWGFGISGDLPILLVRITEAAFIPLVRELLQAQDYWRVKGLRADVVILNEHPAEYLDETHDSLNRLIQESRWAGWQNTSGGIFLLRADGMPPADRHLFGAVARIVLRGDMGGLASQLDRPSPWLYAANDVEASAQLTLAAAADVPVAIPPRVLENGVGGFAADGRDYLIALEGDRETPQPWSNVLANPEFGTMVSASGAAFTWAGNSRENRLTPFANDPVADPTGEAIYLRDDDTGEVWGATPGSLATAARWRTVGDSTRARSDPLRARGRRGDAATGGVRCPRRGREGRDADSHQHVDEAAPAERLRLRGVVSGPTPRGRAPLRRLGGRSSQPCALCSQFVQHRVRQPGCVLARHGARSALSRAIAASSSGATARCSGRRRFSDESCREESAPVSTHARRCRSAFDSIPVRRAGSRLSSVMARMRAGRAHWRRATPHWPRVNLRWRQWSGTGSTR